MSVSDPFQNLANEILYSLEFQHDWTHLKIHTDPKFPRPLVSGLPPRRIYIHPDEQIEIIKAEKNAAHRIPQPPEYEWVLPTHLSEKWTLSKFAEVFDAIDAIPPPLHDAAPAFADTEQDATRWNEWRGPLRRKRVMLAIIQNDSTMAYYLVHDGIVKPRQN